MANAGAMGSYNYVHLTAIAATQVRTGPGILRSITINDATTSAVVTVYDNTTAATPIAIIDAGTFMGTLQYDANFLTGLRIVISGATPDITVCWSPL